MCTNGRVTGHQCLANGILVLYAAVPVFGIGALLKSTGHLSQNFHDLQQLHSDPAVFLEDRSRRFGAAASGRGLAR